MLTASTVTSRGAGTRRGRREVNRAASTGDCAHPATLAVSRRSVIAAVPSGELLPDQLTAEGRSWPVHEQIKE